MYLKILTWIVVLTPDFLTTDHNRVASFSWLASLMIDR